MNVTNAFIDAMDLDSARQYRRVRPSYPPEAIEVLRTSLRERSDGDRCTSIDTSVIDIGAGTGALTKLLAEHGFKVVAVEPSTAMRAALQEQDWVKETGTKVVDGYAEDTHLPSGSADLVTWAQCFHWLDQEGAASEAVRLLRPGGLAAAISNQLDVSVPWVLRLSRIMRSGDVQTRTAQPVLGEAFESPTLTVIPWDCPVTPELVMELAQTRSSYLRSSAAGQRKMQANLSWYLYDHLGFYPAEEIVIPYRTFIWSAHRH